MRTIRRGGARLLLVGFTDILIMLSLTPAGAASANLSRSYIATGPITNGSLVSLDPHHSDQVELANSDNGSRLLGVVLPSDESLIAIDAAAGKVQVATSGTVNVLVSTLGGSIEVGDEVGVSPFSGIGMKAGPGLRIAGLAQTDFNQNSAGAANRTVTDKEGKKNRLTIGYVRLSIAIASSNSSSSGEQLNSLQRFVQSVTGRTVPTIRIALSIIVALTALLVLVTLTYAAIYGSIVSIGRNPLAKYAVFRTLGAVIGMGLLTAAVASVSIFFLLR
jgi:hypothetical protein